MPQLENIEAIEKCLWGAADTLRANSNYASNEYFMPVMGLNRAIRAVENREASLGKLGVFWHTQGSGKS